MPVLLSSSTVFISRRCLQDEIRLVEPPLVQPPHSLGGMRSRVLPPPLGLHDTWYSHVSCFPHFPSLIEHNSSSTIHQISSRPVSIHTVKIYFYSLASKHTYTCHSSPVNSTNPTIHLLVTRSHKSNDREHQAEGMTGTRDNIPRYFAKSGPTDADPRKTKKDGGGKGNW